MSGSVELSRKDVSDEYAAMDAAKLRRYAECRANIEASKLDPGNAELAKLAAFAQRVLDRDARWR